MDVRGVGDGPAGTDLAAALRQLSGVKGGGHAPRAGAGAVGKDSVGSLLQELSESNVASLMRIMEPAANAAQVHELLQAATAAAASGNVAQAIEKLAAFAALDPQRAESLGAEPALASIRTEVESLLGRLTSAASMEAQGRVAHAGRLVEAGARQDLTAPDIRPETLVSLAGNLVHAGGYANAMRASRLAQSVIDRFAWVPVPVESPPVGSSRKVAAAAPAGLGANLRRSSVRIGKSLIAGTRKLWVRAPLLVLLLGWFFSGLAAGILAWFLRSYFPESWPPSRVEGGFEVWGLGFLVLVAFGFWARVRRR